MKRNETLIVVENTHLSKKYCVLKLLGKVQLPEMFPGQFVQIKIENGSTFLRRPISVHDINYVENTFSLLIQVVGKGTETLSNLTAGSSVDIIYPLGNSFGMPPKGSTPLIVGGGGGIAPLLFLSKYLKTKGFSADILLGFRDVNNIVEYDKYLEQGRVFVTTEDGSLGIKGYVTDHPVFASHDYDFIYCCGPEPMMRAVAKYCKINKIQCEVSLENMMGCGMGVCLCCVVDTVDGNVCTCTEGPVFNVNKLKW